MHDPFHTPDMDWIASKNPHLTAVGNDLVAIATNLEGCMVINKESS